MPEPDPLGPPNEYERLHWTEVGDEADEHEDAPDDERAPVYLMVGPNEYLLVAPGVPLRVA